MSEVISLALNLSVEPLIVNNQLVYNLGKVMLLYNGIELRKAPFLAGA